MNVGFPRNNVKLFTTYDLTGDLNRLTLGGGVRWESATRYGNTQVIPGTTLQAKQGSYALVDLLARYRFDEHFTGTLNVNNLFDRDPPLTTYGAIHYDTIGRYMTVGAKVRF